MTEHQCGKLFPKRDGISPEDTEGCHLPNGHVGPHEFAVNGLKYRWEIDMACNCECCMSDEPDDWCLNWWSESPVLEDLKRMGEYILKWQPNPHLNAETKAHCDYAYPPQKNREVDIDSTGNVVRVSTLEPGQFFEFKGIRHLICVMREKTMLVMYQEGDEFKTAWTDNDEYVLPAKGWLSEPLFNTLGLLDNHL